MTLSLRPAANRSDRLRMCRPHLGSSATATMGFVWCSLSGSDEHEACPLAAAGATAHTSTVCLSCVAMRPPGRLETTGAGDETFASLVTKDGAGTHQVQA